MADVSGGRIVWQLDVDDGNFDSQMQQARSSAQGAGGDIGDAFQGGAKIAGIALAGLGVGITLFSKQATDFTRDYALGAKQIARETGLTVEKSSLLASVFTRVGLSADDASLLFGRLSRQIRETADASDPAQTKLGALGVSVKDASGNLLPFDNVLGQVADRFKSMPDGPEKTAIALDLFGRSGKQIIPILNQGSEGIAKLEEKARALGLALTPQVATKIDAFIESQRNLTQSTNALKLSVGLLTAPVLTTLQNKLIDVLGSLHNLDPALQTTVAAFLAFGGPITGASGGIVELLANIKQLSPALNLAKLGIAGLIVLGVLALIGALIFLQAKFHVFDGLIKVITDVSTAIWSFMKPAIDAFIAALGQVWAFISANIIPIFMQLWNVMVSILVPIFQQFWVSIQPFLPLLQQIAIAFAIISAIIIGVFVVALLIVVAVVVAVVAAIIATVTTLATIWNNIWSFMAGVASAVWNAIRAVVAASMAVIVGVVSSGVSAAVGAWNAITRIVGVVAGAMGAVVGAISGGVSSALNVARGFVGAFVGVGSDIVHGIVRGVTGAAGALFNALRDLASNAVKAAKAAIDGHSPSRLFAREVGMPISQGIAMGILSASGSVNAALTSVTSPNQVSSGSSGGGAGGGPVIVNVHMDGIMTRSRQDMRAVGTDLVEAINEGLRARGVEEIGGGNLVGLNNG